MRDDKLIIWTRIYSLSLDEDAFLIIMKMTALQVTLVRSKRRFMLIEVTGGEPDRDYERGHITPK